jgi:small subunit ribosomal protein S8
MSLSDPVADMLTRIRNAIAAHHDEVTIPLSKTKTAMARVLREEGYIEEFSREEDGVQGILRIKLKYSGANSVIDGLKRVSKPSRRVYVTYDHIPRVMSGLGINILSTSQGIMSDRSARQKQVGGEILCSIW